MIPIESLCDDFRNWLSGPNFANPYSEHSIQAYVAETRRYLAFLDFDGIDDVSASSPHLAKKYLSTGRNGRETSKSTKVVRLAALLLFYDWMEFTEICLDNHARAIQRDQQQQRGGRGGAAAKRLHPVLSWEEQDRLLGCAAERSTIAGVRNHATVGFLLDTGLRASEVCELRVADAQGYFEGHLRVTGKGNKERLVRFTPEHEAALRTWLKIRGRLTQTSDHLLMTDQSTPMQPVILYHEIRALLARAAIQKPQMGPHLLRHTAASRWLARGMDMVQVRDNLGHGNLTITSRYAHLLVPSSKLRVSDEA